VWLFFILVVLRIVRYYNKFPIPAFATLLIDNPIRRRFIQNPHKIAERMELKPGMVVLEVGPGKGRYTEVIAKRVEPQGVVYAIDIQESVINRLEQRITKENIENIIPKIADVYKLPFENETIDRVYANAALPEIPNPVKALKEFFQVLKPDGLVSLCELFIDADYPRRSTEKKWATEAGFTLQNEFGNWFAYQLNFKKSHES
jgi:ubiquinone/menaquinone biosynthesis C-methylase UbiE